MWRDADRESSASKNNKAALPGGDAMVGGGGSEGESSAGSDTACSDADTQIAPQKKMLTLEVVPGKSLGFFDIGMPINTVMTILQRRSRDLVHVDIKYSQDECLTQDIVLDLTNEGIELRFDSALQQLKVIDVYDPSKVLVKYAERVFGRGQTPPTFAHIYKLFGPSHPGTFEDGHKSYLFSYPGLSFFFKIPSKHVKMYKDRDDEACDFVPVEFPDHTSPLARRMVVFSGESHRNAEVIRTTARGHSGGGAYLEPVVVQVGRGILFRERGAIISFGDCPQHVASSVGAPDKIYFKGRDQMKIHNVQGGGSEVEEADYFYNYFKLGIDLLFDGAQHIVKKIILHGNFPGHFDFGRYNKCNYRIFLPNTVPLERPGGGAASASGYATLDTIQADPTCRLDNGFIECDAKWAHVQHVFQKKSGSASQDVPTLDKPVIINRGLNRDPFPPTSVYGYDKMIFEVLKNGNLSTVTCFA